MKPHSRQRLMLPRPPASHSQQGIVLLEALISVLIFVIGILGLVGLQAVMLKDSADANYRLIAGDVAQKRLSDIWLTDAADRGVLSEQNVDISAASGLPGGLRTTVRGSTDPKSGCAGADDCYVVTVNWTPPGGTQHNYTIVSTID